MRLCVIRKYNVNFALMKKYTIKHSLKTPAPALMKISKYLSLALFIALFTACITPFSPEGLQTQGGTLVIEGDIILNGATKVYLSESRALYSSEPFRYLTNAQVFVLSEHGETYLSTVIFEPNAPPCYLIDTKGLPFNCAYYVSIFLADGTQFISDPIIPMAAPQIDSIEFVVQDAQTAVDFFVTTYADRNSSPFYRWSYTEDWEYHSLYDPELYYNQATGEVLRYGPGEKPEVYYCWNQSISEDILIAKTDHLDNNTVYRQPLHTIDRHSDKISYLYSLELQQMSISEEAYIYWVNMRKNNQEIGGIFSPQPSEVFGNIYMVRVDGKPDRKVLGYISAGMVATKRIFVTEKELGIYQPTINCPEMSLFEPEPADRFNFYQMGLRPYKGGYDGGEEIWVSRDCIDCRRQGGGNKNKPPFWPNDHQ